MKSSARSPSSAAASTSAKIGGSPSTIRWAARAAAAVRAVWLGCPALVTSALATSLLVTEGQYQLTSKAYHKKENIVSTFESRFGCSITFLMQNDIPPRTLVHQRARVAARHPSADRLGDVGRRGDYALLEALYPCRGVAMSPASGVMVACCQIAPRVGELAANRAACREAVLRAVGEGARIVVLPQLGSTGYVFHYVAEARPLAEPLDGPTVTEWVALAGRLGITLVGGICELGDDGLLYNTAVVVAGPRVLAAYRKVHLWDAEKLVFAAGSQAPPV